MNKLTVKKIVRVGASQDGSRKAEEKKESPPAKKGFFGRMHGGPRKIMLKKGADAGAPLEPNKITPIPPLAKDERELLLQGIKEPYVYARVVYNDKLNEYQYRAVEPPLNSMETEALENIKNALIRIMEYDTKKADKETKIRYLTQTVEGIIQSSSMHLSEMSRKKIIYYVVRDFIGYGKLDILMTDPMIEDISCDGPKIPIFIFHRKFESLRTSIVFQTEEELDSYVIALAQRCGKHISVAEPMLDATIPDGSRLQATLSKEVTARGSSFTIRRFKENPLTPADLVNYNTLSIEMVAYLWLAIQNGESMLVSGGTASGKTTTLNAVLLFIPPSVKIVTIEDTREVNLPHENWIAGLTRSGFGGKGSDGKAAGEIDMFELLKAALRQRPEYIVVGEVRGKETHSMFQAMATGHTTYSTVHADSVDAIVRRLENPPISIPRNLLASLNLVLLQGQVRVGLKMTRRVKKIVEVVGIEPETNELITNTVYEWTPAGDKFIYSGNNYLFGKIMARKNWTTDEMTNEFKRRVDIVKWMVKTKVKDYIEVSKILSSYYKEPEETMKRVRIDLYGNPEGAQDAQKPADGGGQRAS